MHIYIYVHIHKYISYTYTNTHIYRYRYRCLYIDTDIGIPHKLVITLCEIMRGLVRIYTNMRSFESYIYIYTYLRLWSKAHIYIYIVTYTYINMRYSLYVFMFPNCYCPALHNRRPLRELDHDSWAWQVACSLQACADDSCGCVCVLLAKKNKTHHTSTTGHLTGCFL